MLASAYKPAHADNRMRGEGDVLSARADYAQRKSGNLRWLLRSRFEWMNQYIRPDSVGVDVGCGAGFSREFIRCRGLLLTDLTEHDYLDIGGVDALHLPFSGESLDFVIESNVVHHLPHPIRFLDEARRVLRSGGFLLMHEVQASLLFCGVLRAMRHEGYSFDVNVFDENCTCTDPDDPWAGNNAIPRLLFDDHVAFLRSQPGWRILRDEPCECLMFLNSGGVTAKTAYVPLPAFLLKGVEVLDNILAKVAPNVFALGRRIALQKV
ncbi:MAG: class I SAM-dependent methyltransferase [Candidatus Korobacteraceae bacterium]